jgi:hypothetical protein
VTTDRNAHPFGRALRMRSEWRPFPLATITFLGERADITDPQPEVLAAEQTTERHQPVDDMSGRARKVTHRAGVPILSTTVGLYTFGLVARRPTTPAASDHVIQCLPVVVRRVVDPGQPAEASPHRLLCQLPARTQAPLTAPSCRGESGALT